MSTGSPCSRLSDLVLAYYGLLGRATFIVGPADRNSVLGLMPHTPHLIDDADSTSSVFIVLHEMAAA